MLKETEAKARVYKAAVDQLADSMAAGAWQDGPAPKDGSWILGLFHGLPYVVVYDSWEVGGEMLPDGTGSPPDGHESGWCLAGDSLQVMDQDERRHGTGPETNVRKCTFGKTRHTINCFISGRLRSKNPVMQIGESVNTARDGMLRSSSR